MKFSKIAGISTLVLIALAVLGVTMVFAQKPSPTDNPWWNTMRSMMQGTAVPGYGGMMGGNGQFMQDMHDQMSENDGMGAMHEWMHQSGGMHDTVWKALAEKLGLTAEELTAQVNDGKTLAQIAEEKGVAVKDLATVMQTAMQAGLEQAVKDGQLTQEQADLMFKHMDGQYEWMITNMGAGMVNGNMMNGRMMGPNSSGGCHDNDNTPSTQGTDL